MKEKIVFLRMCWENDNMKASRAWLKESGLLVANKDKSLSETALLKS